MGATRSAHSTDLFKRWISFLSQVNESEKNHEHMVTFFVEKFAQSPGSFYEFLGLLRKSLSSPTRTKQNKILAKHYLSVLSPLCDRFGVFEEKDALDTLCFRIIQPKEYKRMETLLARCRKDWDADQIIGKVLRELTQFIKSEGFHCTVRGRYKNLFSIYRKVKNLERKDPVYLYDLFAFRIIVPENDVDACFAILNLLHDRYYPITRRFKDYISIPKVNGYQSIHTCLRGILPDDDRLVEVQIRTEIMDAFAETGLASHWLYARDKRTKLLTEKERILLKQFTEESQKREEKQVTFCSKDGDVVSMRTGSTALDFAYFLHTSVGNCAQKAVVNGETKPLQYQIRECDRVEIKTGSRPCVQQDWVYSVSNASTRKKIYENT